MVVSAAALLMATVVAWIIAIVGYSLLWQVGWRVALGVALVATANKIIVDIQRSR